MRPFRDAKSPDFTGLFVVRALGIEPGPCEGRAAHSSACAHLWPRGADASAQEGAGRLRVNAVAALTARFSFCSIESRGYVPVTGLCRHQRCRAGILAELRVERRFMPSRSPWPPGGLDAARKSRDAEGRSIGRLSHLSYSASQTFSALCALTFACWGVDISRAQQPDFDVYARAVEFCRAVVKRPMMLDLDKRILCFDGTISAEMNVSSASALEPNGLFVVRSPGGEIPNLYHALADLILDRYATVVVYDYCLSACASFLLIASTIRPSS